MNNSIETIAVKKRQRKQNNLRPKPKPRNRKPKTKQRNRKSNIVIPSHQGQEPSIFKLDADCMDKLFDYLTLKELCIIGRTCKHLQHAAGMYFGQNYPTIDVEFGAMDSNGQTVSHGLIYTNFAPYAQRIVVCGYELNEFRRAASIKYRNLKEIEFVCCDDHLTVDHYKCIVLMTISKSVTAIHFLDCSWSFRDSVLDGVHDILAKIKSLSMNYSESSDYPREFDAWKHQHIPTLERFEMLDKMKSSDLKGFLQANRQIKQLCVKIKMSHLEAIQESGIELDELELDVQNYSELLNEQIRNRLVSLHTNGQIKNLSIDVEMYPNCGRSILRDDDLMEELAKISFLTSLTIQRFEYRTPDLSPMVNLKKLCLDNPDMCPEEMDFAQELINLEELYVRDCSLLCAIPFANHLPKLRIIEAEKRSYAKISLKALNDKRKELPNANLLKIFLHDKAYRQMRWWSTNLFYDMVEVRRAILEN